MSSFPGSPRTAKGSIICIDPTSFQISSIKFQYNPDELSRTLKSRMKGGDGGSFGKSRPEVMCIEGAPTEVIGLNVVIDAADLLEEAEKNAVSMGIYPQLSALETLVRPKSALVIANVAALADQLLDIDALTERS